MNLARVDGLGRRPSASIAPGERREFYRAEADVWTLFRRILAERKRRELDPTLLVLDRTAERASRRSYA